MAASLDRVPAELLEPISSGLSASDILSLSKSSKSLYSKAHPLLLRHVKIDWDMAKSPEKTPRITRLLELILKNPDYARYIKRVEIVKLNYEHFKVLTKMWVEQGVQSPLRLDLQHDDSLARLVRNVISELCLPDPKEWYKGVVEDADLGAIVALILAQCTQLESLRVNLDFIAPSTPWGPRHKWVDTGINPWFRTMFGHAVPAPGEASRLTRFNKLTEFTVSPPPRRLNRSDIELPRNVFFSSFYLPNITTLSLDHALDHSKPERLEMAWGRLKNPTWPFPNEPLPSKLTTLQLTSTTASTSTVEFLLRQTPSLQCLVYDCTDPIAPGFDLDYLQLALGHVCDTLRQLVVRLDPNINPLLGFAPIAGRGILRLGSLARLEDLEIALGVLYGNTEPKDAPPLSETLPATLKRLTINDNLWQGRSVRDSEWRLEPSGTLLKTFFGGGAWKSTTPLLEEFVLDLQKNGAPRSKEYWGRREIQEELQNLVESQGIRCSILWDDDAEGFTLAHLLAERTHLM